MYHPPPPGPARPSGDVAATAALLIIGAFATLAAVTLGAFSVMGTDSCGVHPCDLDTFSTGLMVVFAAAVVGPVIAVVGTLVALARGPHVRAWIWPAIGLAVLVGVAGLGLAIELHGVAGS